MDKPSNIEKRTVSVMMILEEGGCDMQRCLKIYNNLCTALHKPGTVPKGATHSEVSTAIAAFFARAVYEADQEGFYTGGSNLDPMLTIVGIILEDERLSMFAPEQLHAVPDQKEE